jgi:hypothetical protein
VLIIRNSSMQWCGSADTRELLKQEYSMASSYIVRHSNLIQGQVAQVRNVLSTFIVITESPLIALLNGMSGFVEPDSGLYINNRFN